VLVDPLLGLTKGLSIGDHSTVDAVVRAAAGAALAASRRMRRRVEVVIDRMVDDVGGGTLESAIASRKFDDEAVDGAVEGIAAGIQIGGEKSRQIQTGMSHDYYKLLVAGSVVAVIVAAIWR
jgi:hypothetical protein